MTPGGRRVRSAVPLAALAARAGGRLLVVWAIDVGALAAAAWALPGLELEGWRASVLAVGVIGLLNALVRPALLIATGPLVVLTFGAWTLVLSAGSVFAAGHLVPGFAVRSWAAGLAAPLAVALVNAWATGALRVGDDAAVFRRLAARLARPERGRAAAPADEPGLLVVEIDGLSHGALARAAAAGALPTLGAWLASGTHRLRAWDCGLPSQTSSSQAGILWGTNDEIPGFRWYEKGRGALVVSGRPADAARIEARLTHGTPLLAGGAGHCNMFTGGARRAVLTVSTLRWFGRGLDRRARELQGYFLDPYHFARAAALLLWEVAREIVTAAALHVRGDPGAPLRGGAFALKRAVATVVLRDVAEELAREDVGAGVPVTYVTFAGYDVVAHNTGADSRDARRVLRDLDGRVRRLARAAARAPRPYHVVVLSDHGQSDGRAFRAAHGTTLEALVRDAVRRHPAGGAGAGPAAVLGSAGSDEVAGHVAALARALRPAARAEQGAADAAAADARASDAVVCTSGNLGLVYFPTLPGRATLDRIEARHPGLLDALVRHPGVGFVLARSAGGGALVLGARGAHDLGTGGVTGDDPLAPFGPRAADHLRRLDRFATVGDLVVNSAVDARGHVLPFEEQAGSHGGLGGEQTDAFLLAPAHLPLPAGSDGGLVGPPAINRVLRAWLPADAEHADQDPRAAGSAGGTSPDRERGGASAP